MLKILSRVTTQTEGRIARVRAGDRSWKVADRCNQAAGRPRGRLPLGSPKGEMSGSERINGQIASLLEVGTGFHPELTVPSEVSFALHRPSRETEGPAACRPRQRGKLLGRLPQGSPKGETSGNERVNEQPKVGPKGAAPEGRRKSKYFPERGDFGDAEG